MSEQTDYKKTAFGYTLDDDEAEILQAMDAGEFVPVADLASRKAELQADAQAFSGMKRKSINIRIPEYNLDRLKQQANRQGLPFRR